MEHFDVVIVGAGLSGIGAASHLRAEAPGRTFAILEARDAIGGTWDLFRYPGIRSDSDMFTLGYAFKPWLDKKGIADGGAILRYIRETARENRIEEHIRFRTRVQTAEWSSATARWTITVRSEAGIAQLSCSFLFANAGYYRYDEGYTPAFEGIENYTGQVIHPQHWPEELDYSGKRIAVIGSGATAVTLVPALAQRAEHVTMVQRSPTYIGTLPSVDPIAQRLRRRLSPKRAYAAIRWKNIAFSQLTYQLSRRRPEVMKRILRKGITDLLPPGYDVATNFTPRYNPWDQRLCLSPDGDLFQAISAGKATVVTDRIAAFTPDGLRLANGTEVGADIVVTATGLNLLLLGGIKLVVDGKEVVAKDTLAYKGTMLSGVPNFALTIGYTNASWTLKADLVAQYVTRLLNYMERHGYQVVTPQAPAPVGEWTDPLIGLKSGYVLRSLDDLPKQGPAAPWRLYQNYPRDLLLFKHGRLADGNLRFARAGVPARA